MRRAVLFLLAIALVITVPHFLKQQMPFAPVTGISMAPVLEEGDLITYEKISPSQVEVGDIIVYSIPPLTQSSYDCSPVVVHRVVEIKENNTGLYYRTRGDNNPARDPWSVRQYDLIGKMSHRISYLGFPLLFLKSCPGLILLVMMFFASALCFYAVELGRIRHIIKRKRYIFAVHF